MRWITFDFANDLVFFLLSHSCEPASVQIEVLEFFAGRSAALLNHSDLSIPTLLLRDPFFGSWVYYHHVCSSDWEDEPICVCGDMMQSRRWRSLLKAVPPGNCRVSKIVSGGFGSVAAARFGFTWLGFPTKPPFL